MGNKENCLSSLPEQQNAFITLLSESGVTYAEYFIDDEDVWIHLSCY